MAESQASLTPEEEELVQEELGVLAQVTAAVKHTRLLQQQQKASRSNRFVEFREEAARGGDEDLPALLGALSTEKALFDRLPAGESLPDLDMPYFAHVVLEENGRRRDLLFGSVSFLRVAHLPVNDWRTAPIAQVFKNHRVGDEYELEIPGRLLTGVVKARRLLTFYQGSLKRIEDDGFCLTCLPSGEWVREARARLPILMGGSGSAARQLKLFSQGITAGAAGSGFLDAYQLEAAHLPSSQHLVVMGGAGSGKTTVALARLYELYRKYPGRFSPHKMLVVVPEEGLARLTRKLLDSLELERIEVKTFDAFIERRLRLIVKKLPRTLCTTTPAAVVAFKRHPALLAALPQFIAMQRADLARVERESGGDPAVERAAKKRFRDLAKDRIDMFASRAFLQEVMQRSQGTISAQMMEEVHRHSVRQFAETSAKRYASVDEERLLMIDGKNILEETEEDLAQTIDVEDFAVLYALYIQKMGFAAVADLPTYEHLLLDEAQELAPVELIGLKTCLSKTANVTVAGDPWQQTSEGMDFLSWAKQLELLGITQASHHELKTTYRSTREIVQLARQVFAQQILADITALKSGPPVHLQEVASEGHLMVMMGDVLKDLLAREPTAQVAIICRHEESARRIHQGMSDLMAVRLTVDGAFTFTPGVDVTDVSQVKGLEFDYVIIPDANPAFYPDDPRSRRTMHVAATRAIHQLWIIAVGHLARIFAESKAD